MADGGRADSLGRFCFYSGETLSCSLRSFTWSTAGGHAPQGVFVSTQGTSYFLRKLTWVHVAAGCWLPT